MGKRIDVMVDVETFGLGIDATIFQISAVTFDIESGTTGLVFNATLNLQNYSSEYSDDKLEVEAGTLLFWLKQPDLLKKLLLEGEYNHPADILLSFRYWLNNLKDSKDDEVYLWGNGILFDNAKLKYQLEKLSTDYPIHYRRDRDVRTIVDLAYQKTGLTEKCIKDSIPVVGDKHNALDDCVYQIKLVCKCHRLLMGETEPF